MKELSRETRISDSGRYMIVDALICGKEFGGRDMRMRFCETLIGNHYIGDLDFTKQLCDEHKISPELRAKESNVCSIGLGDDGKWYGWSHRALFGFEIGSTTKAGDCSYKANNREDYEQQVLNFFCGDDDCHQNPRIERTTDGFDVVADYADKVPNEKLRGTEYRSSQTYPDQYGKGEWVAETIEDAKQMACDFAESVS